MASFRTDRTESSRAIDPDLRAILTDLDNLRGRVAAYVVVAEQRQLRIEELESTLRFRQRELADSRQEVALLRERPARPGTSETRRAQNGAQGHESELQTAREERDKAQRELRHARKVLVDLMSDRDDDNSSTQSSIQASSPNSTFHAQSQPMPVRPMEASTPLNPDEPASRAARTRQQTHEPQQLQTAQSMDMPESVTPVARTPTAKKSKAPKLARGASSSNVRDDVFLSPSGLPVDKTLPATASTSALPRESATQVEVSAVADQRAGRKSNSKVKGKNKMRARERSQDPWDTGVTYDGPEEIDEDNDSQFWNPDSRRSLHGEESHALAGVSTDYTQSHVSGLSEPSASNPWQVLKDDFPKCAVLNCGPMKTDTLTDRLQLSPGFIERLDGLKGQGSFHLLVDGEHIFIDDPIGLDPGDQRHYLINWGEPALNEMIRKTIWDDGQRPYADYHTYVRRPHGSKTWYYMGKLRWSMTAMAPKWPKYNQVLKGELAATLIAKWRCELNVRDVTLMIEMNQLEELCIELTNTDELAKDSVMFAEGLFPKTLKRSQARGLSQSLSASTI